MSERVTFKEATATVPPKTTLSTEHGFPEIITETETNERVETTKEEFTTPYPNGPAPAVTAVTKIIAVTTTKIRTTTPYTGTIG